MPAVATSQLQTSSGAAGSWEWFQRASPDPASHGLPRPPVAAFTSCHSCPWPYVSQTTAFELASLHWRELDLRKRYYMCNLSVRSQEERAFGQSVSTTEAGQRYLGRQHGKPWDPSQRELGGQADSVPRSAGRAWIIPSNPFSGPVESVLWDLHFSNKETKIQRK